MLKFIENLDFLCNRDTTVENLVYLNSQQALADIAYFIEGMNERNNFAANTKWILFGGSYSGSLVAWARQKYPHLVFGAIASSAPIVAKSDFYGRINSFFNVKSENVITYDDNFQNTSKALKIHSILSIRNVQKISWRQTSN